MSTRIDYRKGDEIGECFYIKESNPVIFDKSKSIKRVAIFECRCGKLFEAVLNSVKNGNTTSCGCVVKQKARQLGLANKTHGKRNHPLYKVWRGMLDRCYKSDHSAYKNYGDRGIKVCDEWHNINNFINDMYYSYKKGYDIDRINNNENYSKDNCRWVTRKQNMNNMRRNKLITYNGITKTMSEWADQLNIPYTTLRARMRIWKEDVDKVFTTKFKENEK